MDYSYQGLQEHIFQNTGGLIFFGFLQRFEPCAPNQGSKKCKNYHKALASECLTPCRNIVKLKKKHTGIYNLNFEGPYLLNEGILKPNKDRFVVSRKWAF